METIKNYLDNMFMGLPKTQEVQRAKEELLAMMEDKYQELKAQGKTENEAIGIVISEFGNLEEVAEILGIAGYMRKNPRDDEEQVLYLTREDAQEYIEASQRQGIRIGLGVMFCILSPIVLIVLDGASQVRGLGLGEQVADGIGLLVLLILVAAGVGMMIMGGITFQKYEDLKKETIALDYAAEAFVREEETAFQGGFAVFIGLGVVLCVLSVVPVSVAEMFGSYSELADGIGVGIMLFLVAVGVLLFIMAGMRKSSYDFLLQKGVYERK